jgi:hypothetical protein
MRNNEEIWKQVQPSDTVDEDGYWADEWDKFLIRNSWVFSQGAPEVKDLDEARNLAKCDWAGIVNHRDAQGNGLDDQFGSWHNPPVFHGLQECIDSFYWPPVKPLSSFIVGSEDFNPKSPYVVHLHLVGAEFSDDCLWAARVWDMSKNCEASPRFYAQFLGQVMTKVYPILRRMIPGFGDPEWNENLDRQKAEEDNMIEGLREIERRQGEENFINSPVKYDKEGVPVA